MHGSHCTELRVVAIRVLAQVVSATSCERNWSDFGHIHTNGSNRLTAESAADLTSYYASLRLYDRIQDPEREDRMTEWDVEMQV